MVLLPEAYHQPNAKLLNSYAMDIPQSLPGKSPANISKVRKILERMMGADELRFPSVGSGEDCRYTAHGLLGSGLLVEEWFVHMAFFRTTERQRSTATNDRMAPLSRRRASRII